MRTSNSQRKHKEYANVERASSTRWMRWSFRELAQVTGANTVQRQSTGKANSHATGKSLHIQQLAPPRQQMHNPSTHNPPSKNRLADMQYDTLIFESSFAVVGNRQCLTLALHSPYSPGSRSTDFSLECRFWKAVRPPGHALLLLGLQVSGSFLQEVLPATICSVTKTESPLATDWDLKICDAEHFPPLCKPYVTVTQS